MGCHFLLQGIFLTQGSNLGFLHCRQILYHLSHQGSVAVRSWTCLVAQTIKRLPTMQKTQVRSLGQEDPLEKEMASHSSILA